ncbi:preprotein translocase subunit SecG [Candidatus Uhrbacteria bacterium]|nr:preprotein translocase subunit SecG [Candidatus Uhrbacteria bacterium]
MKLALTIIQGASAALLIVTILMQSRGAGVSSLFGGEGNIYRAKRGVEKALFVMTILFAILFLSSSLARLFFP